MLKKDLLLFIILSFSAFHCESGNGSRNEYNNPRSTIESKVRDFVMTSKFAIQDFNVSYHKTVRESNIAESTEEIMNSAMFFSALDSSDTFVGLNVQSLQDTNIVDIAKSQFRTALENAVKPNARLYTIHWSISDSIEFTTIAVISTDGKLVYEPVMDAAYLEVKYSTGLFTGNSYSRADTAKWFNILGNVKAWTALVVTASGSDDCQAAFSTRIANWSEFPFVIDQTEPKITKYCKSPVNTDSCTCREQPTMRGRLECAKGDMNYNVVFRIGTPWLGADLHSYGDALSTDLCADEAPEAEADIKIEFQTENKTL